jgi:hypothetical protein
MATAQRAGQPLADAAQRLSCRGPGRRLLTGLQRLIPMSLLVLVLPGSPGSSRASAVAGAKRRHPLRTGLRTGLDASHPDEEKQAWAVG